MGKMKKKLLLAGLVFCLGLTAGCGKKADQGESEGTSQTEEMDSLSESSDLSETEDLSENSSLDGVVTLGEYKGLTYTQVNLEVTQEELDEAIQETLSDYATIRQIMDRAVAEGDVVNIDFAGYVDGVAFDGGTAAGYNLEIGSGSMIPGFEEGIVGVMPGKTVSIDVTFPEEYRSEGTSGSELNGQAAVFDITVNYIQEETLPEYTEEFVITNTEYDGIEEFEESLRSRLAEEKMEQAESDIRNELFDKLMENTVIQELPEAELAKYHDSLIGSYQSMADSLGMELADFLSQYYYATEDDLEEYASQYAEVMANQSVIFQAIAERENISVSEEEYQEALNDYFSQYGEQYESLEIFESEMGELIRDELLYEKVEQFVVDNAVAVSEESDAS